MKFCNRCGSENKDDATYCKSCGEKLYEENQNYQDGKNIKKIGILIGIIALLVFGVIFFKDSIMYKYYISKGNDQVEPWKAVEYYSEAIKLKYDKEVLNKIKNNVLNSDSDSTILKSLDGVLTREDFNDLYIDVFVEKAKEAFEKSDYDSCETYLKKAESKGYDEKDFLYYKELAKQNDDSKNNEVNNNYYDYSDFNSAYYSDGYIIPDSDVRYLTESELLSYSKTELEYIKNELYARHGRIFNKKKYRDYFSSKSWYYPNPSFNEIYDFNDVENHNRDLIVKTLDKYY